MLVLTIILGGTSNVFAQPTFTQCDPSSVMLQPGGSDLVFDNINIPALLNVAATPAAGTVTYTASPASLTCADIGGMVSVTITATDDNGSTTCITNVTVSDGGVFASCMDITKELVGGTAVVNAAEIDDNSSACTAITVTGISKNGSLFAPTQSFSCADGLNTPIPVEITVEDANGASAVCMANVTLIDEAPVAMTMNPAPLTLDANGMASITVADVDNGSSSGSCGGGMTNISLDQTNFDCSDIGTVTVTLTVTNASGETDTETATVLVQDNTAPALACPAISVFMDNTNSVGGVYTLQQADYDAVENSATEACGIMSVTASPTTINCSAVGGAPVPVTFTVTDVNGNADNCVVMVTAFDNTVPDLTNCPSDMNDVTSTGSATDCYGAPTFNHPDVLDGCPSATPLTVAYTAGTPAPTSALPAGGNVTPGAANTAQFPVGQTIVTYTATDDHGNNTDCSFTVTITDDQDPFFTNIPADITVTANPNDCDNNLSWTPPTVNDNCLIGTDFATVTVSNTDVVINNSLGTLGNSNGVDFGDIPVGVTTVTYDYRDPNGLTISHTLTITVNDAQDPTITCPPGQTLDFGPCNPAATLVPDYTLLANADDNCTIAQINQTPAAGTAITAIPGLTTSAGESFTVTLEAVDGQGNTIDCTFNVTLTDTNLPVPTTNPLPTINETCGTIVITAPTALNECGTTINGVASLGTQVSPTEWEYAPGNYTVQWTYNDNGAITTQFQQINVSDDNELPVLTCQDLVINLDNTGAAMVSPTEVLGQNITLTSGNITNTDGWTTYTTTVTSAQEVSFTWTYENDEEAGWDPFGYVLNGNFVQLTDGEVITFLGLAFADGDQNQTGFTTVSLQPGDEFGFYTYTWDGFGAGANTSVTSFSPGYTGDFDISNFTLTNTPDFFGIAPNGNAVFSFGDVTDNCGVDFSTAMIDGLATLNLDCDDIGTQMVTVTVADINGNVGTCTANITVEDNIAPQLFNVPTTDDLVSCGVGADTTGLNVYATDNCGNPSIIYNRTTTQAGNPDFCSHYTYEVTNTYTAIDANGNQTVESFTIEVEDVVAPEFAAGLSTSEVLSVGTTNCQALAVFNISAADVVEECANFDNLTLSYTIDEDNDGVINGSGTGNAVVSFGTGNHSITYTVTDPCGNVGATFTRNYTVIDDTPPIASCNGGPFTIGIPSSGSITIPASLVNNNSFDNCSQNLDFELTRPGGLPATFTCAEADGVTEYPLTLTVTDLNSGASSTCSSSVIIEDNVDPVILCQNVTVSLDENGAASITVADINDGSFDACSMLDQSSLSLDRTDFTTADVGMTIPVTLTGMDNNGNSSSCTANVTVTPPPTCFQVDRQLGGVGEVVALDVTIKDFVNVSSFQFTLSHTDKPVAEFAGITNVHPALASGFEFNLTQTDSFINMIDTTVLMNVMGMDSIVYDTTYTPNFDQIAVSYVGSPVTLADDDVVFQVEVELTGVLGDFSEIYYVPNAQVTGDEIVYVFNAQSPTPTVIVETPCINDVEDGFVGIRELVIGGMVHNEYGDPVKTVAADLFDTDIAPAVLVDTDTTNAAGEYEITLTNGGDFEIIPSKNINWYNETSIADVSAIQQHAVGNAFLDSPYKKIAADVFEDGQITGADALILSLFVNTAGFGTPPSAPSWRFVPADQVLANDPNASVPNYDESIRLTGINTDTLGNNFIGIKTGDVAGIIADPQRDEPMAFTVKDQQLTAGETVELALRAEQFDNLVGYQWILEFDASKLEYVENEIVQVAGFSNISTYLLDEGKLILTWYNGEPTSQEATDELMKISFKALTNESTLNGLLNVKEYDHFQASAFNENYEKFDIQLVIENDQTAFELMQNKPNPFKAETVIGFNLPEAMEGSLEIHDVTGKVIRSYPDTYTKGYNEVTIYGNDLPAAGVLFYQFTSKDFTATKQMIYINK